MPEEDFDSIFEQSDSISRGEAKRMVAEEIQKTLADINLFAAQAQAGQQAAIREVTAKHADFEARRPEMLAVLQEIPILNDAIKAAEANPQLAPTLPQMYEVVYRASHAPANSTTTAAASDASEPSKSRPSDLSDENTQYQAALASQRVDLSPASRKALIAELEKRGVGDIEF